MAYEFRPESTPVLYFKPKSHVPYHRQRIWLLWPVYAYRVIAPLPSANRSLNIFQKAVLGFCRIQQPSADVISRYLHLEPELIEYILVELRRKDLLNADYHPTLEGNLLLREEVDDTPSEILTGYVFQDPWTKQLWPRVVDKLQFAPVEYDGDEIFPTLVFGSTGKPRPFKPFVKRADFNAGWKTPAVQDILDASYRHQRDLKRLSQPIENVELQDEEIELGASTGISHPQIQKIALISEDPEPYYLVTFLYRPETDPRPDEWYACDPFGLGASSNLMRWISDLTQRDDLLRERIEGWLQNSDVNYANHQIYTVLDQNARLEIETRFTNLAELMPFYSQMFAMVRSALELAELEVPPRDKLNDILIKAAIMLEAVLDHVRGRFPAPGSTQIYNTTDWQYRHDLLSDIAGKIGFVIPAPRKLANIEPKRVLKVEKNGGTLGERMTAALLAARSQPEHPFWWAAQQMPDMLDQVSDLIYVRAQSSHFTDYVPTKQDVSKHVDLAMNVAKLLSITEILQEEDNNEFKK